MQRRQGYTLIELLVSMALIMTIMAILSQAYVSGLDTFSKLKGIGDMSEKLREASTILRRDLAADHFTGSTRLSDPTFTLNPPREGFIQLIQGAPSQPEGVDGFGNPSYVATSDIIYFTVKLRGNRPEDFFVGDAGVANMNTTFFNQPKDARYDGVNNGLYSGQWAEVCYYLLPIANVPAGSAMTTPGAAGGPMQQLYALYRAQRAIVANNTGLAGGNFPMMSISPATGTFNTPSTVQNPANRAIKNLQGMPNDALLLSDVLNFDVRAMPVGTTNFTDVAAFDTANLVGGNGVGLAAVKIIIRVWDLKTRQTRQVTVIQDL